MLFKESAPTYDQYLFKYQQDGLKENRVKQFHGLVLQGKLWTSVWWITEMDKCRFMHPGDVCLKTGNTILDVLH